jgi:hypothetical protein
MRSIWSGRSLEVSRKPERGWVNGCGIITTSGLTKGLGGYALRIGILRFRPS